MKEEEEEVKEYNTSTSPSGDIQLMLLNVYQDCLALSNDNILDPIQYDTISNLVKNCMEVCHSINHELSLRAECEKGSNTHINTHTNTNPHINTHTHTHTHTHTNIDIPLSEIDMNAVRDNYMHLRANMMNALFKKEGQE